jgi:hypothetical protein
VLLISLPVLRCRRAEEPNHSCSGQGRGCQIVLLVFSVDFQDAAKLFAVMEGEELLDDRVLTYGLLQ